MKAMVYREYGEPHDVLRLDEIEKPVQKDDEVLVRVHAASVNPLDSHIMTTNVARIMGHWRSPAVPVPGVDVSGVVEAAGKSVTRFAPGDAVFGICEGAFAEFACAKESKLALKPPDITHEQAASLPVAGLTALQGLRVSGKLKTGQRVLITGASGGVGTFAVQVAKYLGAEVTAVCSTGNIELARRLGADHVIDRLHEDITGAEALYDVIFDIAGGTSLLELRRSLKPKGTYIRIGLLGMGPPGILVFASMLNPFLLSPFVSQKMTSFVAKGNSEDLSTLADLVAAGKITPVIDRIYQLSETPDAIQYIREKRARGKAVITPT